MALVIVNADDYGLTEATSLAILRCHSEGIVTSTSLLTLAPAFDRSARLLTDHPDIGVGVHLAAVGEDPPLLTRSEIPTLVDTDGALPVSWRQFLRRASVGRIDPDDVEREWSAQVDRALGTGTRLTHLDSHQHLHQWPLLWPAIRRLATRAGVSAIRTTSGAGPGPVGLLGHLTRLRARRARLLTTDTFAGFRESGALDEDALVRVLDRAPLDGSLEIGCHPGALYDPDRSRYDWGFEWAAEATALRSEQVRRIIEDRGDQLATFADLQMA